MTPAWFEALSSPAAYPDRPAHVESRQTHISWLFFAGAHVYKLKKPVDFGFVDYTSLARRKHFCEEELRLNRRLAPDTYLGVVPVTRDTDGRITLGGAGEVLEYAVRMRRLPAERMLDALLDGPGIEDADVDRLAALLVDFHARADTGAAVARHGSPRAVRGNVLDNFSALRPFAGRLLPEPVYARLERHARGECDRLEPLLAQRAESGRVVDGHGDLHAGNICFTAEGIAIYDCVEFSAALRCADVCCDLAFLTMDLDHAGCWALSDRLHRRYAELAGDPDIPALLDFYQGYRAMVRCKVAALRWRQAESDAEREAAGQAATRYARLALTYALGPVLILCCGLPGSGKTHLARQLTRRLGLQRLSSDELRGPGPAGPGYGQGRYSPEQRSAVYAQLAERAAAALQAGQGVMVDAGFGRRAWREAVIRAAGRRPWLLLELEAAPELIEQRLRHRQEAGRDSSQADFRVYQAAAREREPPEEVPAPHRLRCRSPAEPGQVAEMIQDRLLKQ